MKQEDHFEYTSNSNDLPCRAIFTYSYTCSVLCVSLTSSKMTI